MNSGLRMTFALPAALLLAIMLAPIIAMVAAVSPGAAAAAFAQPEAQGALRVSLAASFAAIAVASVLGVPAGYAIAHASRPLRDAALALLALPLAFPPVASGIILLEVVGTRTAFGAALQSHGIAFVDTIWGVALAEFFVAGSFVAITATAAFAALDRQYEESARTLGASPLRTFLLVALPLAAPNVLAGIMLAWMRAIGEYGATSIVAYRPASLPVQLYVTLSADGVAGALALSYGFALMAAIVIAVQWALRRRVV